VLIADDYKGLAEELKRLLSVNSEIVGVVADGRELLELAISTLPDVVVCDLSMPGLNGLDAIRALRKEGPKQQVRVVSNGCSYRSCSIWSSSPS
jgi:DNA-binding NarL/FixJ family response regulator